MIDNYLYKKIREKVLEYLERACIVLTPEEIERIEITDFGLGDIEKIGLQLITYVNTTRVCAKELILLPNQICPEHRHPPVGDQPGKEETFRCRWGKVYLYVPGEPTENPYAADKIPRERLKYFTVWKEIILTPGHQYTLSPNTLHWFIAGEEGAVVSEFSTMNTDEYDIFTDPEVVRIQKDSAPEG